MARSASRLRHAVLDRRLWLIVITTSWLVIFSVSLDSVRMAKLINEIMISGKYISLIWFDVLMLALVFAVSYAGMNGSRARRSGLYRGTHVIRGSSFQRPSSSCLSACHAAWWRQ